MSKSELKPLSHGHFQGYSSSNRAGVFNEVAISSLQMFTSMMHSMNVRTILKLIFLSEINIFILQDNETATLASLLSRPAQIPSLNFPLINGTVDTAGILIHKGRDHGIPSYINYLNLCEAQVDPDVTKVTFEDLEKVGIDKAEQKLLKQLYM